MIHRNGPSLSLLVATLAHVVRAWSESSMRIGLCADNKDLIKTFIDGCGTGSMKSPRACRINIACSNWSKRHEEIRLKFNYPFLI